MKGVTVFSTLVLGACLNSGCVAPPPPTKFYWENYSQTLYRYKKTPSEDTLLVHQRTLEKIIEKAQADQRRKVPPGIYAELGQIYSDKGQKNQAISMFQMEADAFPESATLMMSLIEKAKN